MENTLIKLDVIRTDGGTQPRAAIEFEAVDDYTDAMANGEKFPPVVIFYDGAAYWLADGFHRVKAARQAGYREISCQLHQGTLEDAQWYSFGANKTNGLRRTNEDKRRAVKAALMHPKSQNVSDREIARHVGVHPDTVCEWRKQLLPTVGIRQSRLRTGADGRTIDTSNIGGHKQGGDEAPTAPAPCPPREPARLNTTTPPDVSKIRALVPQAQKQDVSPSVAARTDPADAEWCMRVVRACKEIADCPVGATKLAALIGRTEYADRFFNHLEKANEFLTEVAQSGRV